MVFFSWFQTSLINILLSFLLLPSILFVHVTLSINNNTTTNQVDRSGEIPLSYTALLSLWWRPIIQKKKHIAHTYTLVVQERKQEVLTNASYNERDARPLSFLLPRLRCIDRSEISLPGEREKYSFLLYWELEKHFFELF